MAVDGEGGGRVVVNHTLLDEGEVGQELRAGGADPRGGRAVRGNAEGGEGAAHAVDDRHVIDDSAFHFDF